MIYNKFNDDLWSLIKSTTEKALISDPMPIAAFDADGTLWDTDLGEAFFQYQIDNKLIDLPSDPWNYYYQLKKKNNDPSEAYLWLAQINSGISLATLQKWAKNSIDRMQTLPIFTEQKKLINYFIGLGIQVYIVTASIKWAVDAGAPHLGLTDKDVIGIETEIENGLITDKQKGVITYRQGKVEALMAKTNGKKPFFCSGNTMGDFQLMDCSSNLRLGVSGAKSDHKNYQTELMLLEECKKRGWQTHNF